MVFSMGEALGWKQKWLGQLAWGALTSALIYIGFYEKVVWWIAALSLLVLLWSLRSHPKVSPLLATIPFRVQWPTILKKTLAFRKLGEIQVTLPEGALFSAAIGTRGTTVLIQIVENTSILEILDAKYGSGDRWADVADALKNNVRGGRLDMLVSNNDLCADPFPGASKVLNVSYIAHGEKRYTSFNEAERAVLPRPLTSIPAQQTPWQALPTALRLDHASKITAIKIRNRQGHQ